MALQKTSTFTATGRVQRQAPRVFAVAGKLAVKAKPTAKVSAAATTSRNARTFDRLRWLMPWMLTSLLRLFAELIKGNACLSQARPVPAGLHKGESAGPGDQRGR
jgi:hypothetical protein